MHIDRTESFLVHALTATAAGAVLFVAFHGALAGTHGERVAHHQAKAGAVYVKHAPAYLADGAAAKRAKG